MRSICWMGRRRTRDLGCESSIVYSLGRYALRAFSPKSKPPPSRKMREKGGATSACLLSRTILRAFSPKSKPPPSRKMREKGGATLDLHCESSIVYCLGRYALCAFSPKSKLPPSRKMREKG